MAMTPAQIAAGDQNWEQTKDALSKYIINYRVNTSISDVQTARHSFVLFAAETMGVDELAFLLTAAVERLAGRPMGAAPADDMPEVP